MPNHSFMFVHLMIEEHLSVNMFEVFLSLQENKPADPENYVVFEDILLTGQV